MSAFRTVVDDRSFCVGRDHRRADRRTGLPTMKTRCPEAPSNDYPFLRASPTCQQSAESELLNSSEIHENGDSRDSIQNHAMAATTRAACRDKRRHGTVVAKQETCEVGG